LGEWELAHLVISLEQISIYMSSGDTAFWPPQAPPCTTRKCRAARSHPVTGPLNVLQALVCCDSQFRLPLSLTLSTLRAQLPFAALWQRG